MVCFSSPWLYGQQHEPPSAKCHAMASGYTCAAALLAVIEQPPSAWPGLVIALPDQTGVGHETEGVVIPTGPVGVSDGRGDHGIESGPIGPLRQGSRSVASLQMTSS